MIYSRFERYNIVQISVFSKFIYSFNANSIKVLTWVLDCNSLQRPECIGCASSLVHGGWLTLMKLPVKGVIITDGQAWKIEQVFNQEPDCSCFIKILCYFLSDFVIFIRKQITSHYFVDLTLNIHMRITCTLGGTHWKIEIWTCNISLGSFLDNFFQLTTWLLSILGFPGGSDGKESICNVGDLSSIPGLGRPPGGGQGNPLRYSCLENPQEQRSLMGDSLWGCRVRHDWATKHPHHIRFFFIN